MRISYDSVTANSFEVQVTDLETGYAKQLYWYLDGKEQFTTGVTSSRTYSSWEIFEDLEPDTTYTIYVEIYDISGNYIDSAEITITTVDALERPDYFEWDIEKVKGEPFNITADEWCRLLDNINDVLVYKGYSKMSSTSNPEAIARFYYPSSGEEFLSSMYNQCIYAFTTMELVDYSGCSVMSGDIITADSINFLRDIINDVK